MSRGKGGQACGQYMLEYKLEVVRRVKGAQALPVTVKAQVSTTVKNNTVIG